MLKKFVLIDAHSIIFRSYFAFINNPLRNSKGENTSGIFGFLNTLEKVKKRIGSEYICLTFDAPGKTFRDEVYEEYKATRPPTPADIPFQVEKVKQICQYLGIPSFELEGYEADDILATFALKLKHKGEVYIVTSDKDLMQLVSDKIFVYDAYKDLIYDQKQVMKKFGVSPERVGEYLALTGDASDNIPGVPGIGPKRAVEILKKYPGFENAIQNEKRIVEHKKQALLSKKLVTLECNVPLDIKTGDIAVQEPDIERLMPILLDLELHSYIKILSKTTLPEVASKNINSVADIKTGRTVGIFLGENSEIYLCTDTNKVYTTFLNIIKDILVDKNIVKIGYNLKELAKIIDIKSPLFDVGIAAWLMDPNKRAYKLEDIALHYLNEYSKMTPANASQCLFQLYAELTKRLKNQKELYQRIEEPLIHVLAHMEQKGIKIDLAYLQKLGNEFAGEISRMEKKIHELAGKEFNINSPKQLSKILFEDLQLKPLKRGKSHYSTNVNVLQQLSLVHKLPKIVLRFREYSKIKSTFIDPLIAVAKNNRIHTTFNQTGTSTGRLSSKNPNIQNIPIRTEVGRRIRKGFIADNGFYLISADYSQIELRLLADISKDDNLINAFKHNKDIHRHTASLIFNISEKDVDESKRRMAKVVNYGLIYGMSDYGLVQRLDIRLEEATQFIQSYYNLYPEVERWRDQAISLVEDKGYTETMFGRKRPLPDIHSKNHALREFSKRAAINTPIQGTAADLIKLAMIETEKRLLQAKFKSGLLLSIHDELVFEIEKERIDEAKEIIRESMENVIELAVPIIVSIGIGKNWNEAH
ncbi:DNA polymerase I [candidate division WOR-3 bacterium]|nr:DNA polymerase I [candidate division WOR-3 bacterium]